MQEQDSAQQKRPKKRQYIFGAVVVLFIAVVTLAVVLFIQDKKEEKALIAYNEAKNALRDDLDDLIDDHNNLLEEYGELNNQLVEKDSTIRSQIAEIRNLIRTKEDLKAAKAKMEILKTISKKYLKDIDSLYTITTQLNNEKDSVIEVNKNINWRNYKLNKVNKELTDKVNKGSVLEIGAIFIETLKYRNSGKEVVTTKASKVITIRTTFNIKQNLIAEKGVKNVYFRFLDPNQKILLNTNRKQVFKTDSAELKYSLLKQVQYENKMLPISIDFKRRNPLIVGDYLLEIYIDRLLLGTQNFNLK